MFSSEFSHGWESGGHVFRVEINSGISADTEYYFTIDGVKFHDFQKKPSSITPSSSNPPRQAAPRPSQPAAQVASSTKKAEFQTKPRSGSFDPFSASPAAPATSAAPSAEVDFFGSNDTFGGSSSDPFGQPTAPAASSSDPFGSSNGFSDPFGAPQSAPAASKPADDFFSTSAPKPAVKDNFNDFSGLTYTPAPPSSMMQQPRQQQQNMSMNAPLPPAPAAAQQAPKDPWSSLVNLDLSNKQAPTAAQASVRGGPTLNQMGPSATTGSASFKPVGDPFASVAGPSYGGQPANRQQQSAYQQQQPAYQQQQPAYQQQQQHVNRQSAISGMGDPFAAASNPYGMQGNPYGAGSQGGYGAQAPNAYGRPPAQNQKTSLDNLDWKF